MTTTEPTQKPLRATEKPPAAKSHLLPPSLTQSEIDARFEQLWLVVGAEEGEADGVRRTGMWSSKPCEEDR
jgi:hypothetical protein